jgi:hypothetical protein
MKEQLKNRMAALVMGMAAGAYATEQIYGYGEPRQKANTISKGEAKKCKSCTNYPCPKSKKPMQIACNGYERKKKKK